MFIISHVVRLLILQHVSSLCIVISIMKYCRLPEAGVAEFVKGCLVRKANPEVRNRDGDNAIVRRITQTQ